MKSDKQRHRTALLLFIPFLFVFCLAVKIGWVIPDGIGYTSFLASLFLDGDLHLLNQYKLTGIIGPDYIYGAIVTRTGYIFSFWSIGNSLLLMIFWLLGEESFAYRCRILLRY